MSGKSGVHCRSDPDRQKRRETERPHASAEPRGRYRVKAYSIALCTPPARSRSQRPAASWRQRGRRQSHAHGPAHATPQRRRRWHRQCTAVAPAAAAEPAAAHPPAVPLRRGVGCPTGGKFTLLPGAPSGSDPHIALSATLRTPAAARSVAARRSFQIHGLIAHRKS